MTFGSTKPVWTRRTALIGLASFVAGCSPSGLQLGSRTLTLPWLEVSGVPPIVTPVTTPAEKFGRGPVSVALLLPLSGPLGQLGIGLANAARLAVGFIEANPNIAENITISLRDSGEGAAGATAAAHAAVSEGPKLILGPVAAEQVTAAGMVARASGIILANVNTLSMASPPYSQALLTNPSGFAGRDGLFRLYASGRSDYALVIRQVGGGVLEGAKLA